MVAYLVVARDQLVLPNPPANSPVCRAVTDANGRVFVTTHLASLLPNDCLLLSDQVGIAPASYGVRLALDGARVATHFLLTQAGVERLLNDYL